MENEIVAHHPGAVEAVEVAAGDQVSVGQALVRLGRRSANYPHRMGRVAEAAGEGSGLPWTHGIHLHRHRHRGVARARPRARPRPRRPRLGPRRSTPATPSALRRGRATLAALGRTVAIPGDVADPDHRGALVAAAGGLGGLDLLVNNASALGPTPLPALADYPLDELGGDATHVNVVAPLALVQLGAAAARARRRPRSSNITSDAAVEGYEGWGGYGSSKAALEQLTNVLAAEEPDLRVYWVDPGDMRTQMHQDAFPGEDISDRPPPEASVPGLARADRGRPPERPLPAPASPRRGRSRRDEHRGPSRRSSSSAPSSRRPSRPRRAAWPATPSG